MKKFFLAAVAILVLASFALAGPNSGGYTADVLRNVNEIKSNSNGFTLTSKGVVDINATGALTIDAAGLSINATTPVYVQVVSGTAGTTLSPLKSVICYSAATEAGATVTLSSAAVFQSALTYNGVCNAVDGVSVTGTVKPLTGSTLLLKGAEGVKYFIWLIGK